MSHIDNLWLKRLQDSGKSAGISLNIRFEQFLSHAGRLTQKYLNMMVGHNSIAIVHKITFVCYYSTKTYYYFFWFL